MYSLLLILLFVIPPLVIFIKWTLHFIYFYKNLKRIPSPPTYPIIGNIREFKKGKGLIQIFHNLFERYNTKLLRVNFGLKTAIYITDYNLIKFILSSNTILKKGSEYNYLHDWLGTGLLTASGSKWKHHRKILTPAFHFKILEQFVDTFNLVGDVLVQKLKNHVGKEINIYPFINLYSLDIICETAMGTSVNAQSLAESPYVKSVKFMCTTMLSRIFNPLYSYDFLYRFTSMYRKQCEALEILHGYSNSVIKKKKESSQNITTNDADEDDVGSKKKIAFLDLLLEVTVNGEPLSDHEIREEVDTFMFAGHDTTTAAMSFLLFMLSKNQNVQLNLYQEIVDVIGTDNQYQPKFSDLQNLKYTEMVIKETLRMYPPVPVFIRETTEEIRYKDFVIPKGCALKINSYQTHRDPDYFPNPDQFDPERFAQTSTSRHPYVFIPFSAGPRNCIGQKFAMLLIKCTVVKILRTFHIKSAVPAHEMDVIQYPILTSSNGMVVKLENRVK